MATVACRELVVTITHTMSVLYMIIMTWMVQPLILSDKGYRKPHIQDLAESSWNVGSFNINLTGVMPR